jgi:hypothetical protein
MRLAVIKELMISAADKSAKATLLLEKKNTVLRLIS